MNELDLKLYVYALYFLMVVSTTSFALIIRKIESDTLSKISLRYFNGYFIVGAIGWISHGIKDSANIDVDLTIGLLFYLLASGLLLVAVAECGNQKESRRSMIMGIHLCIAAISLLMNTDPQRILFLGVYCISAYSCIAYLTFNWSREKQNFGHAIIFVAALLVATLAPCIFYSGLVLNDFGMAYGFIIIGSSTGYILVGTGLLTVVMVAENKKMQKLALYDPLTGLYNRRGMDLSLNHIVSAAHRAESCISAISMDIDFFKKINDAYGHDGGDYVLKKFAEALLNSVRPNDVCCRLGGEEFVIVLPETQQDYALMVAERIRQEIEALKLMYEGSTITLTSSFGIATHCKNIDIDYLLKDADKALYAAKAGGRNQVCVDTTE
jgi:diguanylate cyclase (GGDEF)-like protein